mgnify:CR=1 FL=1
MLSIFAPWGLPPRCSLIIPFPCRLFGRWPVWGACGWKNLSRFWWEKTARANPRCWRPSPEGGTRNFRFSTARTHAELYRSLVLQRGPRRPRDGFFLRAESFYNVATEIDRLDEIAPLKGAYGGRSLHEQSHGESFLALVLNRFSGSGLYLLDEPEAALSPARQLALLAALDGLVRKNSQFLIATHSPLLLAYPNAEIFVLSERGIEKTPYRQTEPYLLTKRFLEAPERMLNELLGTEEEAFEAR